MRAKLVDRVNYLPQPFEESLRELAELSFPTKLSTYAAAGRPLLVHCPDYASLAPLFADHPLGAICTSLKPVDMVRAIEQLADDSDCYRTAATCVAELAATEFSQEHYRNQFLRFMGLGDE